MKNITRREKCLIQYYKTMTPCQCVNTWPMPFHWLMITRWINDKLCLLYVTTSGQIIRSNYTNTKAEWRLHVPFERQKCINYVSEPLCASFSSNLTWDWNLHKQRKFELVQTFVTKIILLKVILLLNMIMEQLTVKIKLTTHYRASTQWV